MSPRFMPSWQIVQRAWRDWRKAGGPPEVSPGLLPEEGNRVEALMSECLAARHGEVSARQHAAALGELYLTLDMTGRRRFLEILASRFSVDQEAVRQAARQLSESEGGEAFSQQTRLLREALVPPRQQLMQQFNALPQGGKFLIDMRADLLGFLPGSPELASLDYDLKQLLATWFDVGFLQVERITWQSPAALLEKLMAYEAVHAIDSWRELHHRLESDRHCYAFFHPVLPDEPLIFIEVALVEGLSTSIQNLLDEDIPEIDPAKADTAIFYSISNTQAGLKGISFGPFLIKKVVDSLRGELPNLKTFSTLSPIPGFHRWLESMLEAGPFEGEGDPFSDALVEAARVLGVEATLPAVLDDLRWMEHPEISAALKEPLLILCARYLHERRDKDGAPLDPVARFHLGNGARIEQINWQGDVSVKGMQEACGLMVNYLYRLDEIEQNIEAYATDKQIAAAARVRNLMRDDGPSRGHLAGLWRLLSASRGNGAS
ncbi:MAG: malonyl-CoA decarboxylase [Desulfuromonadales bacterium]|nr:malonyl-CoA decarboxylase [Desulfuromonadales bacterium]